MQKKIGKILYALKRLVPGFIINKTPIKPAITDNHLRYPTTSFKKIIEKIVTKTGVACAIETTSANCIYLTPINVEIIANVPAKALTKCNVGLSVLKKVKILFLGIKKKIGIDILENANNTQDYMVAKFISQLYYDTIYIL